ncbi:MAG TPA: DUF4838 domain-containing protein, partial [bacterium]|nr:DUF4838 domain-containing protein [bacterium]
MQVFYQKNQPVVKFAAEELKKYLKKASGQDLDLIPAVRSDTRHGLHLFLAKKRSEFEDEIIIQSEKNGLFLSGSNPRSVLFAVYAYLEKLGFAFLFPGEEGEVVPRLKTIPLTGFNLRETASYRHRGITIEGYPGKEHVLAMIDWMAKHRFNEYFLQFQHSLFFFKRFYENTRVKKLRRKLTLQAVKKMDEEVIREIKKRGLILERCGHGWTAEVLGLPNLGWWPYHGRVSPEKKELMALTGGKRQLFGKIPINTELCYANPKAFNRLVDVVVKYLQKHPEVDILHFWLSDAHHNWCECPVCQKFSLSDWYMKLVREISKRARAVRPGARVVFLSYENTLRPPTRIKPARADNLIFMFAPITRCYYHPLTAADCTVENHGGRPDEARPRTNKENLKCYSAWKRCFSGDSFLFDYHFMRANLDFLGANLPSVIHRDMKDLKNLGLNGMLSCQMQRIFYPTGLPMVVMGKTLWNRDISLAEVKKNYLQAAFGKENGKIVDHYFQQLYELLLRPPGKTAPYSKGEIKKALSFLEKKKKELELLPASRSRQMLLHHRSFLVEWLKLLALLKEQQLHQAKKRLNQLQKRLWQDEEKFHQVLDF